MSTLTLSHVSPGGTAPGAALGYRLLTQSGVSGSDAGFALGTQGIGSAVVLNVMFWLALVAFLATHGFHAPTSLHGGQSQSAFILVFVAAGVGVILLGAFGGLFYLLTGGQERASRVIHRIAGRLRFLDADRTTTLVERLAARFAVLTENRSLTRRAIGWAAANWLLDAASLWVFVAAFGHFISPIDLLVAYGLANILAAVPITPAGLGVVEFVLVSMMTGFGPTAGAALSGVLAYRAVNFWLPIPFGGLAYGSLEFQRRPVYQRVQGFVTRKLVVGRTTADITKARVPGVALGSNWLPAGAGSPGTCAIGTPHSGTSSVTDWTVTDRIGPLIPRWSATISAAAGTGATVTAGVRVQESPVRTAPQASDTEPRASDTRSRASATEPWAIRRTIPTSGRQVHRFRRPTSPPTTAKRQRIPRGVDRANSVPRAGSRARRGSRRVQAAFEKTTG